MMSFDQPEIARFFAARARHMAPAIEILRELEQRGDTRGTGRGSLRAHLDRLCQQHGHKINEITGRQAANLLCDHAWGASA